MKVLTFALIFLLSSVIFIYIAVESYHSPIKTQIFYHSPAIQTKITEALSFDHNTVLLSRMLHNKPLVAWQIVCDSFYRAVDIPFLFSFTNMSSLYDNTGNIKMWIYEA